MEEYEIQGEIETRKARRELQDFCRSPQCNAWETSMRLRDPERFYRNVFNMLCFVSCLHLSVSGLLNGWRVLTSAVTCRPTMEACSRRNWGFPVMSVSRKTSIISQLSLGSATVTEGVNVSWAMFLHLMWAFTTSNSNAYGTRII